MLQEGEVPVDERTAQWTERRRTADNPGVAKDLPQRVKSEDCMNTAGMSNSLNLSTGRQCKRCLIGVMHYYLQSNFTNVLAIFLLYFPIFRLFLKMYSRANKSHGK